MPIAGHVALPEQTPRAGRQVIWWWAAAILIALAITIVSLLPPRGTPGPQIADLGEVIANIGHFIGYLLLAFSIAVALSASHPWFVWLFVSGYGAVVELVQGLVGLRSFQLTDILVNALGAGVGIGIARAWHRRFRRPNGSAQIADPT